MGIEKGIFRRTELLVGQDIMDRIANTKVIIFGVGGVGSWCAEALVRSGVQHLTIVDSDRVCITNVNRQLMATMKTVGQVKVEALKTRLEEINPNVQVVALQQIYSSETSADFDLDSYDYTVDAIDSLKDKAHLILTAAASKSTLFSSMGAALKVDPTKVAVSEFWKVNGDPLGAAIRKKFRKAKIKPAKKFKCVYSTEVLPNLGENKNCGTGACLCPKAVSGPGDAALLNHEWCSSKAQINGTFAHITAIFGMQLSGLILQDIYTKVQAENPQ